MSVNGDEHESEQCDYVRCLDREDRVRLTRLIIEGLEVALHLSNTFLYTFGPVRLIDILEQILPTAYVVNTAYWPLYRTETGHSACVCAIFDTIVCPHSSRGLAWIRLDQTVDESVIFKDGTEKVTLADLSVSINQFTEKQLYIDSNNCARYKFKKNYEIQLEFKARSTWPDGTEECSDTVKFRLWFKFLKPKTIYSHFCLCISPHPIFTSIYGKHFTCLLDNLEALAYPACLLVSGFNCPKHTIVITHKVFSKCIETLTLKDVGLEDDRRQRA